MAEKYEKSVSTINVWLRHARTRGLLTPYVSKNDWGHLTEEGQEILDHGPVTPQREQALTKLKQIKSRREAIEEERETLDSSTRDAIVRALDLNIPLVEISSALGQNRSALYTKYRDDIMSNSTEA